MFTHYCTVHPVSLQVEKKTSKANLKCSKLLLISIIQTDDLLLLQEQKIFS